MTLFNFLYLLHWNQVICFLLLCLTIRFATNHFKPVLRRLPGPFLASCTDFWRLINVAKGHHHDVVINLHRLYRSKLVRIGPNVISVADPDAVKVIYGLNKGFKKTSFYAVQQSVSQGKPLENLFNTQREDFHAAIRRPVANAYSMTSLLQYEGFVDTTSRFFCKRLIEGFIDTNKPCDLGTWLQYYAFDVIGEMTFSKRLGFLDSGSDVSGIIQDLERRLSYFAWCGQMPSLDRLLLKSPLAIRIFPTNRVVQFTLDHVAERLAKPIDRQDFLSMFLRAKESHPQIVTDRQVISYSVTNIFAGSDTTAISLRAMIYNLLKTPRALEKLLEEIDGIVGNRDCWQFPITYHESQTMPYLQAVIKEGLRIHPAVGLLLEREVPPEGCTIADEWIPGGTIVGVNPWVLHRDQEVFGPDVDIFRPERWLESDPENLKRMERSLIAFGSGPRTCIGRNISLLEMSKIIPLLLRTFKFELVDPDANLTFHNMWFVKQSGLHVFIKLR